MKVQDRYLDHRGVWITAEEARGHPGFYVTDDAGHPLAFYETEEAAQRHVAKTGRVMEEAA